MIITLDRETFDTDTLINEIRLLNGEINLIVECENQVDQSKRESKIYFYIKHNYLIGCQYILKKIDIIKIKLDDINKKWASKLDKTEEESSAIAAINKEFNWIDSDELELDGAVSECVIKLMERLGLQK